jgi:hypothetical protein
MTGQVRKKLRTSEVTYRLFSRMAKILTKNGQWLSDDVAASGRSYFFL